MGIVLASLFALVVAEPVHHTYGFVKHATGAVTPDDTDSVKMQKALHAGAHATAAINGYKAPFVYSSPLYKAVAPVTYKAPMVQKVEVAPKVVSYAAPQVVAPVTYTHSVAHSVAPVTYTTPYVYGAHHAIYKREAEAEAKPEADAQVFYNNYASVYGAYPYASAYNYAPVTYTAPVATTTYTAPVTTAYTTPYVYGAHHAIYKREAEAEAKPEADAQVFYNNPVVYNNAYSSVYGAYPYAASTYNYAPVTYTTPVAT